MATWRQKQARNCKIKLGTHSITSLISTVVGIKMWKIYGNKKATYLSGFFIIRILVGWRQLNHTHK